MPSCLALADNYDILKHRIDIVEKLALQCNCIIWYSPFVLTETPCCVCLSVSGKVFVVALKNLRLVAEYNTGELLQFR